MASFDFLATTGSLCPDPESDGIQCLNYDSLHDKIWGGASDYPADFMEIATSDMGHTLHTLGGSYTTSSYGYAYGNAIDNTNGILYLSTDQGIQRVNTATGALIGSPLTATSLFHPILLIDVAGGCLYAFNWTRTGSSGSYVYTHAKISLSTFTVTTTATATHKYYLDAVLKDGGCAYYVGANPNDNLARLVVKWDLESMTETDTVSTGTWYWEAIAQDSNYIYGHNATDHELYRIEKSSFSAVDGTSISVPSATYGEVWEGGVVDSSGTYYYAGTSKPLIVQIDVAAFDAVASTLDISAYCTQIWSVTLDVANNIAYWGTYDANSAVLKIQLATTEETSPYERTVAESLSLTDTVSWETTGVGSFDNSLAETMAFTETVGKILAIPVNDAMAFADTVTKLWEIPIADYLAFQESLTTNATCTVTTTDGLKLLDFLEVAKYFFQVIADAAAVVDSTQAGLGIGIVEYLQYVDTLVNTGHYSHTLLENLVTADLTEKGFLQALSDTIGISDSSISVFILALILNDSLATSDTVAKQYVANALVLSGMSIADTVASQATLTSIITDGLEFDLKIILDGEVYQCWVLNTDALYPSLYTNYGFNSFATLNGITYGAKDGAIYTLDGDTDVAAAIQTGVKLNLDNMGTHYKKRLYRAYFGVSGSTPAVKVISDEGVASYYIIDGKAWPLVKGHEGRKWSFELTGVDAVEFAEITPVILAR